MISAIEKTFDKWLEEPFPLYILEKVDLMDCKIHISSKTNDDEEICFKFITEIPFEEVLQGLDTIKEDILLKSKKQRIQLFQLPQLSNAYHDQWLRVGKFTFMYGLVEVRVRTNDFKIMTLTVHTGWTFEQLILGLYDKYEKDLSNYEILQFYDHFKVVKFGTSGNISQFLHSFNYHYIPNSDIYKTYISMNVDLLHSSFLPPLM